MKKFTTIIAGVILASCLTLTASAQVAGPQGGGVQSGGGDQKAKRDGAKGQHMPVNRKVLKELNLTPDQMSKVKDLFKKYAADAKAGSSDAKPDRKTMRAKREQMIKDLNAILTPEQQTKLKESMAKGKKKKDGVGTPPPADKKNGGN